MKFKFKDVDFDLENKDAALVMAIQDLTEQIKRLVILNGR